MTLSARGCRRFSHGFGPTLTAAARWMRSALQLPWSVYRRFEARPLLAKFNDGQRQCVRTWLRVRCDAADRANGYSQYWHRRWAVQPVEALLNDKFYDALPLATAESVFEKWLGGRCEWSRSGSGGGVAAGLGAGSWC